MNSDYPQGISLEDFSGDRLRHINPNTTALKRGEMYGKLSIDLFLTAYLCYPGFLSRLSFGLSF